MKSLHSVFAGRLLGSGSHLPLIWDPDSYKKLHSARINGVTGHWKLIKGLDDSGNELSEIAWFDNKLGLQSTKEYSQNITIENIYASNNPEKET